MSLVKYVLLCVTFVPIVICQPNNLKAWLHEGECTPCTFLNNCPPVLEILQRYQNPLNTHFFASISCGYIGEYPIVCCHVPIIRELLIAHETVDDIGYIDGPAFYDELKYSSNNRKPVGFTLTLVDWNPNDGVKDELTQDNKKARPQNSPDVLNQRIKADFESNKSVDKVNEAVCGSNTEYRIIGGQAASTGMFPWMARLGYRVRGSVSSSVVNYRCGGALITARNVLTAAHCVRKLPTQTYLALVKLGTDDSPTQTFAPEKTLTHPEYDRPRLHNDIALVRLNRVAVFSDTIMPICLPFGGFSVELARLPPRAMLVAGWGSTSADSNSLSSTLQYTRLTYQPREECANIYLSRFNVTLGPNQICTFGENDRDSCGGDSGGPVFVWDGPGGGARAVGLVSFGARRCGTQGVPTVYTRIDAYQQWIEESVAN